MIWSAKPGALSICWASGIYGIAGGVNVEGVESTSDATTALEDAIATASLDIDAGGSNAARPSAGGHARGINFLVYTHDQLPHLFYELFS